MAAPPLDDYMVRMKGLHTRYSLPSTVMILFKALGEKQRGYDPDGLGRIMRMSPGMRKACTDSISQMAMVMLKNQDPSTIAECTELIQSCTQMLALANEPQTERHFSLKRLPIEIRRRVYGQYFQGVFRVEGKAGIVISVKKALLCSCLSPEGRYSPQNMTILNISLAFTCKALHQEVLTHWYQTHMFYFGCGCDLKKQLSMNASLMGNLKHVKIHWTGPESDVAFKLLSKVDTLKHLIVVVSKSTTDKLSKREREMQRYFRPTVSKNGSTRLCEALGFNELMLLGGSLHLQEVKVEHISKSQSFLRNNDDRYNLERFLKDRLIKAGPRI